MLKRLIVIPFALSIHLGEAWAKPSTFEVRNSKAPAESAKVETRSGSVYRGWDYLVERLRLAGVKEDDLSALYRDPRMPEFSFVPFSISPREHLSTYSGFATAPNFTLGASFALQYKRELDRVEKILKVPREIVVAILVVESHIGQNTGNHLVAYRLSRVASAADPDNIEKNFQRLRADDPSVTKDKVAARAAYLEKLFLPELPSIIEIGKRNKISPLNIKGSIAGAFGLPQFLPSAFLRFGIDGDRNGTVSLYNDVDAIWSAANYLASFGYHAGLSTEQKRAIIWKYNKSDAYIDTVLDVAAGIKAAL